MDIKRRRTCMQIAVKPACGTTAAESLTGAYPAKATHWSVLRQRLSVDSWKIRALPKNSKVHTQPQRALVPGTDGNMQIHILDIYGRQEISLMKGDLPEWMNSILHNCTLSGQTWASKSRNGRTPSLIGTVNRLE